MNRIEPFANRDALADAAAEVIGQALRAPGARAFVATGGASPGSTYDRLATRDLDWGRITVTLSDDRWVDATSPESNEKLVRDRLLVGRAAEARFLALKGDGASPEQDAATAEAGLRPLLPFTAILLGMGPDGHIASLFPGAPDLAQILAPDGERLCVGVAKAGQPPFRPRISLTVAALLQSRLIVLLISGEAKRALVEKVGVDGGYTPPVAAVLRQERSAVRILWAP
ncbi:MAG: 6-phosphogluconolactonase [Caulobacteraceae bacterium]|nr:6-phosphogluconolactonase [Caulobacteraceae bacterium]